jgi:hypothetical protein
LDKIKKLIGGKQVPGFAKQLIMPDLIIIHEKFKEFISDNDIADFYKHIAFNYTFLNDDRFVKAVEFAKNKDIKDIYGRTVVQAREVYKEGNKDLKCECCSSFYEAD